MIQRTLHVAVPVEKTFATWTAHIDLWWPRGHRISGTTDSRIILESGIGGRLFERTVSGDELEYGRVTVWEPPRLLAYDFYLGSSPEAPSQVQIRFDATTDGTRIDIEHRRGAVSPQRWQGSVAGYRRAWADLITAITAEITAELEAP